MRPLDKGSSLIYSVKKNLFDMFYGGFLWKRRKKAVLFIMAETKKMVDMIPEATRGKIELPLKGLETKNGLKTSRERMKSGDKYSGTYRDRQCFS